MTTDTEDLARECGAMFQTGGGVCFKALDWSTFAARLRADAPTEAPAGQAYLACEDCNGTGEVGDEIYQGEFQPPERERCSSCDGSGKWRASMQANQGDDRGERQAHEADEETSRLAAPPPTEAAPVAPVGLSGKDIADSIDPLTRTKPVDNLILAVAAKHIRALTASPATAPQASEPSDEQIINIAERLGKSEAGVSDFESWGLGYRLDRKGAFTIPLVPRNAVPFARAVLALAATQAPPGSAGDALNAERLAFLAPLEGSRFVEQEKGLFRVYEDVAMKQAPHHKWQAITPIWYVSLPKAIDAAIAAKKDAP